MVSEERKFQALLRADFRVFIHKAFTTLSPGQTYVPSWHIDAIADRLERHPVAERLRQECSKLRL